MLMNVASRGSIRTASSEAPQAVAPGGWGAIRPGEAAVLFGARRRAPVWGLLWGCLGAASWQGRVAAEVPGGKFPVPVVSLQAQPATGGSSGDRPAAAAPVADAPAGQCLAQHVRLQELHQLGALLAAADEALGCSRAACPALVRADCSAWLDQLRRATPSIIVSVRSQRGDEVDVRVALDGRPWLHGLHGHAHSLDPGRHVLRIEHPGFPAQEVQLLAREGEQERIVEVDLRPTGPASAPKAPLAAVPSLSKQALHTGAEADVAAPTLSYVLAGLGAVSGGIGAYYAMRVQREYGDAVADCRPFCSSRRVESIRVGRWVADAAIGTSALALVAAGVVYWNRDVFELGDAVRVTAGMRHDGVGLGLRGMF